MELGQGVEKREQEQNQQIFAVESLTLKGGFRRRGFRDGGTSSFGDQKQETRVPKKRAAVTLFQSVVERQLMPGQTLMGQKLHCPSS